MKKPNHQIKFEAELALQYWRGRLQQLVNELIKDVRQRKLKEIEQQIKKTP